MFTLHPTLEHDSLPVVEDDDLVLRLINDARYPWVIIVPKVPDIRELHELSEPMFDKTMALARHAGGVMTTAFVADKINTAAIGNMVPQLHIHVVARRRNDAAWPAPIWGVGEMQPLDQNEIIRRVSLIQDGLGLS